MPYLIALARRLLQEPSARGLDVDSASTSAQRRTLITSKSFLRRIYDEWYTEIARVHDSKDGPFLEIGAGGGFMREAIPGTIASDLLTLDGVDVILDACALPFRADVLQGVSMTNVFHHLPDVEAFLNEVARCLKPGGTVAMVEPWSTTWSRWIFKSFHHEPFDADATSWSIASGKPLSGANGALPWIVFDRDLRRFQETFASLELVSIRPMMPVRYLLSGGVSMRTVTPSWSFRFWRMIDRLLVRVLPQTAMFALIVLRRKAQRCGD